MFCGANQSYWMKNRSNITLNWFLWFDTSEESLTNEGLIFLITSCILLKSGTVSVILPNPWTFWEKKEIFFQKSIFEKSGIWGYTFQFGVTTLVSRMDTPGRDIDATVNIMECLSKIISFYFFTSKSHPKEKEQKLSLIAKHQILWFWWNRFSTQHRKSSLKSFLSIFRRVHTVSCNETLLILNSIIMLVSET